MHGLMMADIAEAQQRVTTYEGDTHGGINQCSAQISGDFLQHPPEEQDALITRMQTWQTAIIWEVRQPCLLTEKDGPIRTTYGAIYLVVLNVAIEDPKIPCSGDGTNWEILSGAAIGRCRGGWHSLEYTQVTDASVLGYH